MRHQNKTVFFSRYQSPIGELRLYADDQHLLGLTYKSNNADVLKKIAPADLIEKDSAVIKQAVQQLKQYFKGERKNFDIPLKPVGTEFQKKAWNQLARIPYGKTITYSDQAKSLKSEKAVRAIGSANGKNPISIIVPCHRVIGANGKLSGYAGGLDIKSRLLAIEGIVCLT